MALGVQVLFKNATRQFNTTTSDDRFQKDFIDACNMSLDALSRAGDLDSAISHITSTQSTISELNQVDSYILLSGIMFHLVLWGREHVIRDNAYGILKGEWEEKKGQFMVNESHELQDSIEDNLSGEGGDIIGIGDVTDIDRTGD